MSLKVWLPLNGTLDNQGLEQVVAMNTNVVYANGKIGKCLSSNSSSSIVSFNISNLVSLLANGEKYSLACWIKLTNNASSGWIIKFGSNSCGLWWARSSPRLVWNENDRGKRSATSIASDYNNWHHVVTTVDKSVSNTIKLVHYVDGILSDVAGQIFDNSTFLQPAGETLTLYPYNALLNDVRLYDHILSPLEVKQISQGLILHYPLNNNGFGQENLLIDTLKDKDKTHTTYSIADYNFSEHLVEGEKYTITASVTTSSEKTFVGIYHSGGSYSMSGWMEVNEDGFYQKTFTATANMANRTQGIGYGFCRVYVSNNPSGGQSSYTLAGTANVNWIKIEKGTKATPWCPNEADKLYTILGLNNNIQYDASGYNHNLKNFNKSSFSSDTPKYNVSTELAGTSYGTHQYLFLNDNYQKELTVSCWIKRTSSENVARYISNSWIVLYLHSNFALRISWKNSTGTSDVLNTWAPGEVIPINTWTHICFTIKNGIVKYYKNGIYISTSDRTQYGTLIHGSLSNGFGGESLTSKNWIGGLSDFRFYCTALSEEDILSLYKNSVYIDNEGNLYGAELREV